MTAFTWIAIAVLLLGAPAVFVWFLFGLRSLFRDGGGDD